MLYKLPESGVVLAIDLGQKVCGLAITDPSQQLAFPMSEINYESEEVFLDSLALILASKKVKGILLGFPFTTGIQQNAFIHEWIEKQKKAIETRFLVPVDYIDESLSSSDAFVKTSKKGRLDSQAALIFLQKYLETRHGFRFHEF